MNALLKSSKRRGYRVFNMTTENFAYWLKGYLEISKAKELTEEQLEEVKRHLHLVFLNLSLNTRYYPESSPSPISFLTEATGATGHPFYSHIPFTC